jgi:hypothetical protein
MAENPCVVVILSERPKSGESMSKLKPSEAPSQLPGLMSFDLLESTSFLSRMLDGPGICRPSAGTEVVSLSFRGSKPNS